MNTFILAGTGVEMPEWLLNLGFILGSCVALCLLAGVWGLIEDIAEKIRVWRWHRMMRRREIQEQREKRRQP